MSGPQSPRDPEQEKQDRIDQEKKDREWSERVKERDDGCGGSNDSHPSSTGRGDSDRGGSDCGENWDGY